MKHKGPLAVTLAIAKELREEKAGTLVRGSSFSREDTKYFQGKRTLCSFLPLSYEATSRLRTSEGRVSSTRMLGPVASGPKAQMERAASRSQSYLVWKNSPSFFLGKGGDTEGSASSVTAGSWGHGACLSGGQSPEPNHTVPRTRAEQETKSTPRACGIRGLAGTQ